VIKNTGPVIAPVVAKFLYEVRSVFSDQQSKLFDCVIL
jgi:hypothetical protein